LQKINTFHKSEVHNNYPCTFSEHIITLTFIELLEFSFTMYLFTVFIVVYVLPTHLVTVWPTEQ